MKRNLILCSLCLLLFNVLGFAARGAYIAPLWASNGSELSPATTVTNASIPGLLTLGLPVGLHTFFSSLPSASAAYVTNIYTKNLPAGDNSILTVPAGYRFLAFRITAVPTNTTIASSWISLLTNGVTTQLRQPTALPTNGSVLAIGTGNNFIYEQNETLVIHCATNLQRTAVTGLIFTNSIRLKSYRTLVVAQGDNVLYTVPANTRAVTYLPPGNGVQHNVEYYNGTAGSVTNVFYLIPSGEIKDINSKLITTVAATLSNGGTSMPPILFPGDSVLLDAQSNGAAQVAWLTVWEQ